MNSKLANDAARAMAGRVGASASADRDSTIRKIFQRAYARTPDATERLLAASFLDQDPSWERFCLAILNGNEFIYID